MEELLRSSFVGPLHVVVDQIIKNLLNLKTIIKEIMFKRVDSYSFQFSS